MGPTWQTLAIEHFWHSKRVNCGSYPPMGVLSEYTSLTFPTRHPELVAYILTPSFLLPVYGIASRYEC